MPRSFICGRATVKTTNRGNLGSSYPCAIPPLGHYKIPGRDDLALADGCGSCRPSGIIGSSVNDLVSHSEIPIGSERSFAVVFTVVFVVIGLHPLLGDGAIRIWSLLVAAAILISGFCFPSVLVTPNKLWFRFGLALGTVVSQVLMALIFFLILTPTGFAMRAFGKVPSEHSPHFDSELPTYWVHRGPDVNPMGSMRNQY